MTWLPTVLTRRERLLHLGLTVVLSLTLVISKNNTAKFIGGAIHGTIYYPFTKVELARQSLKNNEALNQALRDSLQVVTNKLSSCSEYWHQVARLLPSPLFDSIKLDDMIAASVVNVTPLSVGLPQTAVLNKGELQGVAKNMAVVNPSGLIGRVYDFTWERAYVQLLTDPTNRVSARNSRTRVIGIVKYDREDGLIVDNVPLQGEYVPGDTVISAGLGGIYPEGLLIGTVATVDSLPGADFLHIRLQSAVNFLTLEEVYVLTRETTE
jgi:rod shape-determining protein MreC